MEHHFIRVLLIMKMEQSVIYRPIELIWGYSLPSYYSMFYSSILLLGAFRSPLKYSGKVYPWHQ